jgi:microsomal dipeptidase-like Zn-dependent dipeptidase
MWDTSTITFFLCLGALAILIFGLSRASQWISHSSADRLSSTRSRFSSEGLTAIATTAAAIAAGAAAWAAFRQERATFDANLYSKQIEIVSGLSTKMEAMRDRVKSAMKNAVFVDSDFVTDPGKVLEEVKSLTKELDTLSTNNTTQAHFVLPADYDRSWQKIYSTMQEETEFIYDILDEIHDDHGDFYDKRYDAKAYAFASGEINML